MQTDFSGFFSGIIAFGTVANFLAIGALVYRVGRYTGLTDSTIRAISKEVESLQSELKGHFAYDAAVDSQIQMTQIKHGEALARVEVECTQMQRDILLMRDRFHTMANALTAVGLRFEVKERIEGHDSNT